MTCYAFVVGANSEWPEQRCSLGDIGFARCLSDHCQLPRENLVQLYDEKATRSNILRALGRLLDRRNECNNSSPQSSGESDTLLFYYGGHGTRNHFCTQKHCLREGRLSQEPHIKHSGIIDLLEEKFKGGTVISIIDCCHSGGFGQAIVEKHEEEGVLNANYGCIMSVAPADSAGMEWTMTECFMRAFKGELHSSSDADNSCYYLSTKMGKYPIKSTSESEPTNISYDTQKDSHSGHPTWEQVIEYLADEMARIKGDRLTTLFCGEGMQDGKLLLKRPCIFGDNNNLNASNSSLSSAIIPRDYTWMDQFIRKSYAVNDGVYVKWTGGFPGEPNYEGNCPAAQQIGWFPGQIISIQDNATNDSENSSTPTNDMTACIELFDVISEARWTVTLPLNPTCNRNPIMSGLPFGFGFDPDPCANAIVHLAKSLAYCDVSIPAGVQVKVKWVDGKFYKGETLCRAEIPWKDIELDTELDIHGLCVPIWWEEDDSVSFVKTSSCIVRDSRRNQKLNFTSQENATLANMSARDATVSICTPTDAMLASLLCEGKSLQGDAPLLDGALVSEQDAHLEAWCGEDLKWSSVQLMNKIDVSAIPLKVLAYHMCYNESGPFSLVYWESDSTLSMVPNSCLRRRVTTNDGNGDDDSSSSSEEESSVKLADHVEVRKYIERL